MKLILSKIGDFFLKIKDYVDLIKWIAILFLGGTTIFSFQTCSNQKEKAQEFAVIAKNEAKQRITQSGNFALEKRQWNIKAEQLKDEITDKEAKSSYYLNELKQAKKTIEDLNIKLKRVKNYNKSLLESKGTESTKIIYKDTPCSFEIKPIEKKHLSLDFVVKSDVLDINYLYNAEITTVVYREKDKSQFFLWRLIKPDWLYNSVTTIDDPNAFVNNNVNIEFE